MIEIGKPLVSDKTLTGQNCSESYRTSSVNESRRILDRALMHAYLRDFKIVPKLEMLGARMEAHKMVL